MDCGKISKEGTKCQHTKTRPKAVSYTHLPGWKCDIRGIKKYEDLPENTRRYIEFAEKAIGVPVKIVSNGPAREDIIYR